MAYNVAKLQFCMFWSIYVHLTGGLQLKTIDNDFDIRHVNFFNNSVIRSEDCFNFINSRSIEENRSPKCTFIWTEKWDTFSTKQFLCFGRRYLIIEVPVERQRMRWTTSAFTMSHKLYAQGFLKCTATYPIQITTRFEKESMWTKTTVFKYIRERKDNSTVLNSIEGVPEFHMDKSVEFLISEKANLSNYVGLLFSPRTKIIWMGNSNITFDVSGWMMSVPCVYPFMTEDELREVVVFYVAPKTKTTFPVPQIVSKHAMSYHPLQGFSINLTTLEDFEDLYFFCDFVEKENRSENWHSRTLWLGSAHADTTARLLSLANDTQFIPQEDDLNYEVWSKTESVFVILKCISNTPVHFSGTKTISKNDPFPLCFRNPDNDNTTYESISLEEKSFRNVKGIFNVSSTIYTSNNWNYLTTGNISCLDSNTNTILKTWNIKIFSAIGDSRSCIQERRESVRVKFEEANGIIQLSCSFFHDSPPLLSFQNWECFDAFHCSAVYNCINKKELFCGDPTTGTKCPITDYFYPCRLLDPHLMGVFECQYTESKRIIQYLLGFDGIVYLYTDRNQFRKTQRILLHFDKLDPVYSKYNITEIPQEALIDLSFKKSSVYTNERVEAVCKVHPYASNGKLFWAFQFTNGSTVVEYELDTVRQRWIHDLSNNSWDVRMKKNPYQQRSSLLLIKTVDIQRIICFAPIWNLDDTWINASSSLSVTNSQAPEFFEISTHVQFKDKDVNKVIKCPAYGFPHPEIQWFKNGQEIPDGIEVSSSLRQILFPVFYALNMTGRYNCVATNVAGISFLEFYVTEEPSLLPTYYSIGGIVSLLVGLVVYYMIFKRPIEVLTSTALQEFFHGIPANVDKNDVENHEAFLRAYDTKFEVDRDKLIIDRDLELGSGEFGVVYKGHILGYPNPVACKTPLTGASGATILTLLSELKTMIYIGKHDFVLNLVAAYTADIKNKVLVVATEFCSLGSLNNYLRKQKREFYVAKDPNIKNCKPSEYESNKSPCKANYTYYVNSISPELYLRNIKWCYQIAAGMEYLSSKKVYHSDLAARNVLLSEKETIKIADFGLARLHQETVDKINKNKVINKIKTTQTVAWRWAAPESLPKYGRIQTFSSKSDVWSYGVTIWEIFTFADLPYKGKRFSNFENELKEGLRLPKPKLATPEVFKLLEQCWNWDTEIRPDFNELKSDFLQLHRSLYE